ncbi:MAG: ABC transporter substrate-binding protein [Proteobacteria bacterium]|nr:ABC transporter substrate-binding protein [Pseudomonadota bacterium]MBI3498042.1 ABC transporter substrate-binding protein [Pseudomonadota bacterium]
MLDPQTRAALTGLAVVVALGITGGSAEAQKPGGTVIMAQQAQPPSTDAQTTSAQAARNISMHWAETLVARAENAAPINDLAEKVDISADGLTYVFTLRQGVMFHNGKEMTAEDAKISTERYAKVGASAGMMTPVASVAATDKYTMTVKLKTAVPGFIEQLSSPRAPVIVMPREEAAKEANKINHIGTGPFEFVEYKPDSHVALKRFEGYRANPNYTKRDGFGGKKTAYFDAITIRFMPEGGARTAALETGEVHILEQLPASAAKRLAANKDIKTYEMIPWAYQTVFLNAGQAPTNSVKLREAIQIAIDAEEIMAISTEGLFRLTHGWQHPGSLYFAGDVGKEKYDVRDVGRAKALVQESGYKGEEIVFLTDNSFKNHSDTAVVMTEQLKKIGLNIRLQVTDWPTSVAIRSKPTGWNMFPVMMGIEPYEGPYNVAGVFVGPNNFQFEKDEVLERENVALTTQPTLDGRRQAFANIQRRLYERFYAIKVGDVGIYQATRANVANYQPYRIPRMWDVWFE